MNSKQVLVDKEQWSEKSKKGLDYEFADSHYTDKPFTCWACRAPSVFTAEQQKYTYEVKKAHTWEQHVLCQACFKVRNELLAESASYAERWLSSKNSLMNDREWLERWLAILELLPTYRVRKDTARIRMLHKRLSSAP